MERTKEERIEFYARKIIELKAQKEQLEEAEKNYRSALAELVDIGDTLQGEYKINRRENKRFDAALAAKSLDSETLEKISVTKADATKAKALLSEEELALCQKNFGAVVQVGLRND